MSPPTMRRISSALVRAGHRWALSFAILALLLISSCTVRRTSIESRTPAEVAGMRLQEDDQVIGVTDMQGARTDFDLDPPGLVSGDSIVGWVEGERTAFRLTELDRVHLRMRSVDPGASVLASIGVAAAVVLVAALVVAATKESCPFIYSWDGTKWVFDAEPYGGATTQGLERADFSELESLVAVDSEYRLLITNEVNETQYTNRLELWAVHHTPGSRVVADEFGGLHTIRAPVPPSTVVDASGADLRPWFAEQDGRVWEHPATRTTDGQLRQDIVLTFPRPAGATEARLVANVATGLWGSHMIREFYEMRGPEVDQFYDAVDNTELGRQRVLAWNLRDELFTLKLLLEEPTGWEVRGLLPGGGPFISEDRVVTLDLSRVEGDVVRLRIRPPVAFWGFDWLALDYGVDEPVEVERVSLTMATTSTGVDALSELRAVDDAYYAMPEKGEWAELRFPAVEIPDGMEQTFILSSQGYYRLHLNSDQEPDREAIAEIELVPDTGARLAVEAYASAQAVAGVAGGNDRNHP
jgi:hypothetical protein